MGGEAFHRVYVFDTATFSLICNCIALCCQMLMWKQSLICYSVNRLPAWSLELGEASTANFGAKRWSSRGVPRKSLRLLTGSECKLWILLMARMILMKTSRRCFWFMVQYMIHLTFHLFLERVVALVNYFEPLFYKKSKSKFVKFDCRLKLEYIWQSHVSNSNILQNSFANQEMSEFRPKHSIRLHRLGFLGNKGHRVILYNTLLIVYFVPVSPAIKK